MIPLNAGEELPVCPSRCADVIWTLYTDKVNTPPTEIRAVTEAFEALDLRGEHNPIPQDAQLTDVRMGPGPEGNHSPSLAAFQFSGQVYFASAHELIKKTKVIEK
jgi:hypothetical protein